MFGAGEMRELPGDLRIIRARMDQMSEVLVIARLRIMATDDQLRGYRAQVEELEPNREGLLGISTWRSLEADGGVMQIMRYTDRSVADRALEALVSSRVGPLVASFTIDPPDVVMLTPQKVHGQRGADVPPGSFCSFAMRFSDPGLQEDLEMDTEEVLSELSFIPGHLGSIWGNNVALTEEIISLVYWSSQEAMQSSIPKSHKVRIQKWQKVF